MSKLHDVQPGTRQQKSKLHSACISIMRNRQLYLFLIIPVAYIIIFHYVPMAGTLIAFKDYSARKGIFESSWAGLKYFEKFFASYESKRIIKNTLILSIYSLIASFPIPIIFALMVNSIRSEKFRKVTQTIVNLPHFISTTVIVGILLSMLNPRVGLYGHVYEMITGEFPTDLLASPDGFRNIYVWSGVWQGFGWNSIIYTAALAGVDPTYHEAAELDGASRLQRAIHVDLPCIAPTIMITLILKMGSIMSIGFEKTYLMQNALNMDASSIISTYVYQVGLASTGTTNLSYSTAIGLFNSVVNMILVVTANKLSRKVGDTSLW